MTFDFYMPVQVFGGEGCLQRHFDKVAALGARCLIVTGKNGARQSGALEELLHLCAQHGVAAAVFDGIGENPLCSACTAAAAAAQKADACFIVGIGGGSVMDAAKVIAWLASNDANDIEGLYARTLPCAPLPCVLVGTTAGTGSEVTAVSVLTRDETGRKLSVTDARCYARYVFADARYTQSMPPQVAWSTALDALCHAAEGYLSPFCDDAAALFACRAFELLGQGMAALLAGQADDVARQALLSASLWAGMVINSQGTAFPHPMGYILTEQFGVPHGKATAAFLPALLLRAQQHCPQKRATLGRCFGEDTLQQVLGRCTLPEISMSPAQVEDCRARLTGCKHYARTPGGFDADAALALLQQLFVRE